MEARTSIEADPQCVGDARRFAWLTVTTWGLIELRDVVVLLVSELTTNAILHARSPVVMTLQHDAGVLRVSVYDTSPAIPRMRRFSADSATGRGVRLLNSLAGSWGTERNSTGKCVWFTLVTGATPTADEWEFDFEGVEPL